MSFPVHEKGLCEIIPVLKLQLSKDHIVNKSHTPTLGYSL